MKEYDVAIIDSGIEVDRDSNVNGITIRKNPDGLFDYIENDLIDEIGHGTAIYSIINRSVDSSKIFVVKISEFDNDCDNTYLYAALIYIKNNIKCKIINISMGFRTCNNISELFQLCHKMTIEGYIIISSFDNEGCFSYPAAFDCVIGVDSNGMISGNKEFCFVENSPINILGKGRLQRIITKNGKVLLLGGSSIACAYVTAEVSTQATDNMNSSEVLQLLKEKSKYIYTSSRGKK